MSSKSNTIVNLVLVFFISLLSFSIGTFVGKKYSDNQHQLAALEPSKTPAREVASVHGETAGSEKVGSAMSDEEIAKLAEEFVTDDQGEKAEGHGDAHGKVAEAGHGEAAHGEAAEAAHGENAHAAPAKALAKTETAKPSAAAQELAAGKAPTSGHEAKTVNATKENRVPSSLPKDVAQYAVGKFTVQVAAYAEESEAQKQATELKSKGYSAFYIPANVKGKTWYRVSVGQFATQKEAQSYRSELITNAKISSAMVQKITE